MAAETVSDAIMAAQEAASAAQASAQATQTSNTLAFGNLSQACKIEALKINLF